MRGPPPSALGIPLRRRVTALAVIISSGAAFFDSGSVQAYDQLRVGAWPTGANCIDHANGQDYAYVYQCHGEANQQWELTAAGQIRSAQGNCLEYFETDNKVAVVPCDAGRRQIWYSVDNLIKPQGFLVAPYTYSTRLGMCLDASSPATPDGRLVLFGCHGAGNQHFSASFLTKEHADVVQVGGFPVGSDCLDYNYDADFAYVFNCHAMLNQRWMITDKDEFRTSSGKCVEHDDAGQVFVRDCSGGAKQQWTLRADSRIQSKSAESKCLDASTPSSGRLVLADCADNKMTQVFKSNSLTPRSKGVIKVAGPWADGQNCVDYAWGTDNVYVYSCHGLANQLWEVTADSQIQTTDNLCLELDTVSEQRVVARACSAKNEAQKWRAKPSGEVVPLGYTTSTGVWRALTDMCLEASTVSSDKKLQLAKCSQSANQRFASAAFPKTVSEPIYAGAPATTGNNCVGTTTGSNTVAVGKCASDRNQLWEFTRSSEVRLDGSLCLTSTEGNSVQLVTCDGSADQKWRHSANNELIVRTGGKGSGLCLDFRGAGGVLALTDCRPAEGRYQTFTSTIFGKSTPALSDLDEKSSALLQAVLDDKFLSTKVLSAAKATAVSVETALKSDGSDAAAATDFFTNFLFNNTNASAYTPPTKALFATSRSIEFLLLGSILLQRDAAPWTHLAIQSFAKVFSDALLDARYGTLRDYALENKLELLEAYADGTLSDFDELGGMLIAICNGAKLDLSMCQLGTYFELLDRHILLKARLAAEGPTGLRNTTLETASKIVSVYSSGSSSNSSTTVATASTATTAATPDPVMERIMSLVTFRTPFVDVLDEKVLSRVSQADNFLSTFVLHANFASGPRLQAFLPSLVFLSDQVTAYHINKIVTITGSADVAALEAYMAEALGGYVPGVSANATLSDFPVLVKYVLPLVCGGDASSSSEPLSICQLADFYDVLQTVLSFEHLRRSGEVTLEDVLELDVRKKLDVIDQEKKQFELVSTLQDVANKIGSTINTQMTDLKSELAKSTALIRGDIEASRKELSGLIGAVGQQLQTTIEDSTVLLYNQVGQQAAAIRNDIYDSTQKLEQRLDDVGQTLLNEIEQSKQELKYQIGAEAERTRSLVESKTAELKNHMSKETQGLKEFVDAKTNQVIGVVREEGANTRETVNQAKNEIIRVVHDEGAMTRAFVDTKTNQIIGVVREESAATRQHIDVKTNEVIGVVREEGTRTRAFVDEKGNQVIGVVKAEAQETRKEIRAEGQKIRDHIDVKSNEIIGVVKDEGQKTRDHVTQKTTELKQHVTSETNGIKDSVNTAYQKLSVQTTSTYQKLLKQAGNTQSLIKSSSKNTIDTIKQGVGLIASGAQADCAAEVAARSELKALKEKYTAAMNYIGTNGNIVINELETLCTEAKKAFSKTKTKNTLDKIWDIFKGAIEFVTLQWSDAFDSWRKAHSEFAEAVYLDGTIKRFGVMSDKTEETMKMVVQFMNQLMTAQANDVIVDIQVVFNYLTGENDLYDRMKAIADKYEAYQSIVTPGMLGDIAANLAQILNTFCDGVSDLANTGYPYNADAIVSAIGRCYNLRNSVGGVVDRMLEVLSIQDQIRVAVINVGSSGIRCDAATSAADWAGGDSRRSRMLRSLQVADGTTSEPYFAMSFSILTTIVLDYRLQEAAHQFCKFYEYKNGGVAPSMCGSLDQHPHYSLDQILSMRSYRAPVLKKVTMRVQLPSQAILNKDTGKFYPFVDLTQIAAGNPSSFVVPVSDLAWLKKYRWITSAVTESTMPSMFVESIRLYLPVEATADASAFGEPFASAVHFDSSKKQISSWKNRDRVFAFPSQKFTFVSSFNDQLCGDSNRETNPYHKLAGCVQTDGTSDVCIVERGSSETQSDQGILPNLLSPWTIRADYDRSNTAYKLVVPPMLRVNLTTNATYGQEFNLIADVTVLQAAATAAASIESADNNEEEVGVMASTCCAADEYRATTTTCAKCGTGLKGVLNGYACAA